MVPATEADPPAGKISVESPLAQTLGNRTAYAQAFAEGLGVTEFAPRSAAAAEMRAVLAAVLAAVE